jgi:hypothetical protein
MEALPLSKARDYIVTWQFREHYGSARPNQINRVTAYTAEDAVFQFEFENRRAHESMKPLILSVRPAEPE